jgi:hypothetical protein
VWNWHIAKALREPLEDLETRFYLGEIGGRIVGNICTFESGGIGILGHVYTDPAHRHKGVAGGIMGLQMEDFRRRSGKALTLGTGYGSNAYRIYESYGFRSILPESGIMRYSVEPDYFEKLEQDLTSRQQHQEQAFGTRASGIGGSIDALLGMARQFGLESKETEADLRGLKDRSSHDAFGLSARSATWGDGPRLNLLFLRSGPPLLRNLAYGCFGVTNFESVGLKLMKDREDGRLHGAWTLETEDRIPVGFSTLTKAPLWPQGVWLLDLFLHPAFEAHAPTLLQAISWPEGKVTAHLEPGSQALASALEGAGFHKEGDLRGQLRAGGESRDVELWGKG